MYLLNTIAVTYLQELKKCLILFYITPFKKFLNTLAIVINSGFPPKSFENTPLHNIYRYIYIYLFCTI